MSPPEGLAALKIDRARRGSTSRVWTWIIVALLIAAAFAAPQALSMLRTVEVAVAPVVKVGVTGHATGKGGAELSAAGYIVADRQSTLASKATGRLIKMHVAESQHIKKGDIVAEIDHRELDAHIQQAQSERGEAAAEIERLKNATAQADAELASSRAPLVTIESEIRELEIKLADARRKLERDRKVVKEDAMPSSIVDDRIFEVSSAEAQVDTARKRRIEHERRVAVSEAQAAVARSAVSVAEAREKSAASRVKVLEAQLLDSFVYAPFDGVVTEKAAEVGEIVAPISIGGSMARGSIATLAEWESLQAEVDVAEAYIGRVSPGGRAAITVDAFPEKVFPGKVRRIMPRANRSKATVQVRVDFAQRDEKDNILPDMGVRVKFLPQDAPPGAETGAVKEKLVVPKSAVQGAAGAQYVWAVIEQTARKRPVTVGESAGETVEIKSGVTAGEIIVSRGAENLREDGQKVRLAE